MESLIDIEDFPGRSDYHDHDHDEDDGYDDENHLVLICYANYDDDDDIGIESVKLEVGIKFGILLA